MKFPLEVTLTHIHRGLRLRQPQTSTCIVFKLGITTYFPQMSGALPEGRCSWTSTSHSLCPVSFLPPGQVDRALRFSPSGSFLQRYLCGLCCCRLSVSPPWRPSCLEMMSGVSQPCSLLLQGLCSLLPKWLLFCLFAGCCSPQSLHSKGQTSTASGRSHYPSPCSRQHISSTLC